MELRKLGSVEGVVYQNPDGSFVQKELDNAPSAVDLVKKAEMEISRHHYSAWAQSSPTQSKKVESPRTPPRESINRDCCRPPSTPMKHTNSKRLTVEPDGQAVLQRLQDKHIKVTKFFSGRISTLDKDIHGVESIVDDVEKRVYNLECGIAELEHSRSKLAQRTSALEKENAKLRAIIEDQCTKLQDAVAKLQKRMDANDAPAPFVEYV